MTRRRMPVLVAGVILLVVAATRGLAVRTTPTGPFVWTVALDGVPQGIVVDARTHRAFITRSGDVLRHVAVGKGQLAGLPLLDARSGRVFVVVMSLAHGAQSGSVIVLDARSGTLIRTVALRDSPGPVAAKRARLCHLRARRGNPARPLGLATGAAAAPAGVSATTRTVHPRRARCRE
jgi:hypothetical protein